jgi:hypothetical protein
MRRSAGSEESRESWLLNWFQSGQAVKQKTYGRKCHKNSNEGVLMKKFLAFLAVAAALATAAPAMAQNHGFAHTFGPRGPVNSWHPGGYHRDFRDFRDDRDYRGYRDYRVNPVVPFLFGWSIGALTAPRYYAPAPVYRSYDYDYDYDYDYVPAPAPRVYVRPAPRVISVPAAPSGCGCW